MFVTDVRTSTTTLTTFASLLLATFLLVPSLLPRRSSMLLLRSSSTSTTFLPPTVIMCLGHQPLGNIKRFGPGPKSLRNIKHVHHLRNMCGGMHEGIVKIFHDFFLESGAGGGIVAFLGVGGVSADEGAGSSVVIIIVVVLAIVIFFMISIGALVIGSFVVRLLLGGIIPRIITGVQTALLRSSCRPRFRSANVLLQLLFLGYHNLTLPSHLPDIGMCLAAADTKGDLDLLQIIQRILCARQDMLRLLGKAMLSG
mmetsp:Transcript_39227/g.71850  ORF Transcript_39227/g.71850 Transcript_39227/m.71850 type:complete len:255 (-) Transcript_39227:220-984(-)